jgi:hypothetical protein
MEDDALQAAFHAQVDWCRRLDAPFSAALLEWLAADRRAGGPVHALLPGWPGDPVADLVPLRLAGGLHALVLSGRHPVLAAAYPPAAFDAAAIGRPLRAVLATEGGHLRGFLASAPQTNETLRSAVLLGGYAEVARRTGLPLALREIGASAGLNLLWDRFAYHLGTQRWGDPASPVQLVCDWRGNAPALPATIAVADRRANDLAPIDPADPGAALRLRAYVWPDQPERAARLAGALQLARPSPPRVDAGDAADWVERELAVPTAGSAKVLVHSIVWQYLPSTARRRIEAALEAAGARADAGAPLAWLRMEFFAADRPAELRLRLWPGSAEQRLAQVHPHGAWAEWD